MSKPVVLRFLTAGDKEVAETFEKIGLEAEHTGHKLQTTGQKVTAFAKKFTAALGVGVAAVAVVAVKRGDELNESQDQLAKALENSGQSAEGMNKKLGPLQRIMEKFGFTNAQVDDSITAFTRSGIKLKDAIKDEAIAADLAKAKHIDLGAATTLVAKASQGQIKGLKALAIDLPIAAGGALKLKTANLALVAAEKGLKSAQQAKADALVKANALLDKSNFRNLTGAKLAAARAKAEARGASILDAADKKVSAAQDKVRAAQGKVNDAAHAGDKIMGALAKRMKGSAEESTKSLAGKTAALKAKFTDMTAHLGQKLIPVLLMLGTKLGGMIDFFGRNKAALIALTAVVGLFVAAMVTLTIIDTVKKLTAAWTKAQAALNAVMDANPIVLVTLAVVAIGAAIFVAYKKFGPFHDAVDKAWQILQSGYGWVKSNWPLLLAILTGPIGLAVLAITKNWTTIKNGFTGVKNWIGDRVDDVVGFFTALPGRIGKGMKAFGGVMVAPFKAELNGIIRIWNDTVGKIAHGQHIGIPHVFSVTAPDLRIPYLANGTILSSPTLAMLGEAGPEAVIPLSRPRRAAQIMEQAGLVPSRRERARASMTQTVTIGTIVASDPREAARVFTSELAWHKKTSGH